MSVLKLAVVKREDAAKIVANRRAAGGAHVGVALVVYQAPTISTCCGPHNGLNKAHLGEVDPAVFMVTAPELTIEATNLAGEEMLCVTHVTLELSPADTRTAIVINNVL